MASLSQSKKSGSFRVLFLDPVGRRKTITLGKMDDAAARMAHGHIEHLHASTRAGTLPHRSTVAWLSDIGDTLHERIARVGLAEPRESIEDATLASVLERFVETANVKPSTADAYRQATGSLLEFFGEARPVRQPKQSGPTSRGRSSTGPESGSWSRPTRSSRSAPAASATRSACTTSALSRSSASSSTAQTRPGGPRSAFCGTLASDAPQSSGT